MKVLSLVSIHNRFQGITSLVGLLKKLEFDQNINLDLTLVDTSTLSLPLVLDSTLKSASQWINYVKISQDLYWAQAMQLAWSKSDHSKKYDYILCFNDDIQVQLQDLESFICKSIKFCSSNAVCCIGATFRDLSSAQEYSYGGWNAKSKFLPLHYVSVDKEAQSLFPVPVDVINFNLCLIPYSSAIHLNFFGNRFTHRYSDFDFCLRGKKHGLTSYVYKETSGVCPRNSIYTTSLNPELSRSARISRRLSAKEHPLIDRFRFCWSHGGVLWPLYFISPYLKALFFNK